ncbi:carbohydrate-binding protein [Actinoplanes sp. CA-252034]|uniref:carbohydrate-binding protein n=1 Tax=Actinoplanes sp. CA-252034 TaxID=3239906 RepID=UPI003D9669B9
MRGRALIAAAVMLAATWATGAEAATVNRTVLSDGFTGDRGARPDGDVWTVADDRRGFAVLDGEGRLVLGSALRTGKTFAQANGRAEARIQGRRPDGAWRALGVLDGQGRVPAGSVETLASDRVDDDGFHTYAIDWSPATLTWSVDGRKVLRFTRAEQGAPLMFVLNLASGGYYSNTMLVDWVTVRTPVQVDAAKWKAFTAYDVGRLVEYEKVVYKVREAHTSLPGWQPDLVPALFAKA